MCKGSVSVKSDIFFDIIVGPEGAKQKKDLIAWKSGRMSLAIKRLIFFSEIFPKKYQSEFLNELFPVRGGITVQENSDDENPDSIQWSDGYLILAE
jgi:hypothetical protein